MILLSIFLQEGPAETTNYMIMGYTIIFVVLGLYLVSLYIRNRNLKRDVEFYQELERLEETEQNTEQAAVSPTSV